MLCAHVYISKVSVNLFITFTFVRMYAGIYEIYKDPVARRQYEQKLAEEEAKKRKLLRICIWYVATMIPNMR